MIYIKISGLSEGVHNFEFDEPVEKVALEAPFYDNFSANVELEKLHSQLIANVNLNLKVKYDCDRCGKEVESVLNTNYKMVYFFGVQKEDDDSTTVTYLPIDADKISIGNDIHDFAILALPMKNLCSEDCKGLCVSCGKNLNDEECTCSNENVDERWKPLLELKNKLNKK